MGATVIWFFLIVTWSGEINVIEGFKDEKDCYKAQQFAAEQYKKITRDVTDCIGVPLHLEKKEKPAPPRKREGA